MYNPLKQIAYKNVIFQGVVIVVALEVVMEEIKVVYLEEAQEVTITGFISTIKFIMYKIFNLNKSPKKLLYFRRWL